MHSFSVFLPPAHIESQNLVRAPSQPTQANTVCMTLIIYLYYICAFETEEEVNNALYFVKSGYFGHGIVSVGAAGPTGRGADN